MSGLAERAHQLRVRVEQACERAGREPGSVEILAVSKFHPVEAIREAVRCGFSRMGENYVQEGVRKAPEVPEAAFLLIGPLQRNKVRPALLHFQELMTLDRPELAARLRLLAGELEVTRPVWIQVDLWDEATKAGGCPEEAVPGVMDALGGDPRLPLQGFLAIPPPEALQAFQDMAALRTRWEQRLGARLRLSMGMSDDLEAAVAAGTDQVRIGTALFGSRVHP